jgi:type IV pilus assembly protein PilN
MYGLDINFLKDREIRPVEGGGRSRVQTEPGDRRPLYVGLAAAVAALGLVGGYWLFLQQQIQQLRTREAQLDQQIAEIQGQIQEIETIRLQTELIRTENQAFVNVFNQIRPWSAVLQELRDRTPRRIQITQVVQTAGITPEVPEGAEPVEPPAAGGIEVTGVACSFDDINDFMLVLQRSPLLVADTVALISSQRQTDLQDPEVDGTCPGTPAGQPEFLVNYSVQANLTDIPADQLLDTLDRQGAVGLAARIRALRDSGVIDAP